VVDLAKIRKKAKKGTAGGPPAGAEAAPPPPPVPQSGGEATSAPLSAGAAAPAGEPPAVQQTPEAALHKLEKFKAEAGQRRDLRVEQVVETKHQLELLTFLIAGEQYAIDIETIVEIVTPRPITRIPNADPSVVGIISLRGTIGTLVDVRRKLRHRAAEEKNDGARIVVIDRKNETVGFVVDRVLRVVKIAPDEVEPHPVVHTTELEEAIRGVFRVAGALTILLDLEKLLDHSQWT
jgi:purine-binding chemotaxis protein CheW